MIFTLMEPLSELTGAIALALGAGWASGLNLYAVILVLGLLGATGNLVLLEHLEIFAKYSCHRRGRSDVCRRVLCRQDSRG